MNKVFAISGPITSESGMNLASDILAASVDKNVDNIVLLINSGGGDIDAISIVWECIKMCDKPVWAVGMGTVASTAAAIFMMAKERILEPSVQFILHKASRRGMNGSYSEDELLDIVKDIQKATNVAWAPVIENSSISTDILLKECDHRDWILSNEELQKYGIITQNYDREEVKKLLS